MTRKEIRDKIQQNNNSIQSLQQQNIEFLKADYLLSDEKQWFTEEIEKYTERVNRKKVHGERLVGRIHFTQHFIDESTGISIPIERTQIVRINGEWV